MLNVVLYQPEIPQNTGNIMRTCAATNTHLHLIKPLGFSLDEKNIKRSGANYINNCNYDTYDSWEEFLSKNHGDFYFLTRYGNKPHTSFDYSDNKKNIYLVFGRESSGIPKEILKNHLDTCLRIPMTDKVRALNLSNCAAIMIYEVLRQQDYQGLLFEEPFKSKNYLKE
ncbi:MAG: tRNA (uridine(34)/cytosine(34)/5-carboxymethylaminomethyluridine(34)-2'-O)-methyltransferase TrmL [Bacilli bacterium]|nr:tRNA (uridine(34)/cytosine(34)/5-carboxymethylaminomethyluridine(34)-2'-O)-methyltransferase TrmL [Bacilli bacterium]